MTRMSKLEVMGRAYELLEVSLAAETTAQASVDLMADLEVWPREELLRIALTAVLATTRLLLPPVDRLRLRDRVTHARAALMLAEEPS